jgi:tetratricopeptide (TPR) repeat protein
MTTMRRVSSISCCTLFLLLFGLCLPLGHADPKGKSDGCLKDPVCHEHYEQALSQYDAGRYDDALAGFQAAYARRQMPWLLINIGRAVQRLGRPQEAINYYERYKKAEPNIDPEAEKRVNKYIEQARALLEQTPEQPNLPIPPKPEPTPPPTGTLTASPSPTAPTPPPPPATKPIYKKWWFWTIIGVVAAGAVAGGVAGGLASQKKPPAEPFLPGDTIYTPTF